MYPLGRPEDDPTNLEAKIADLIEYRRKKLDKENSPLK